jgi:hypothetical protein
MRDARGFLSSWDTVALISVRKLYSAFTSLYIILSDMLMIWIRVLFPWMRFILSVTYLYSSKLVSKILSSKNFFFLRSISRSETTLPMSKLTEFWLSDSTSVVILKILKIF